MSKKRQYKPKLSALDRMLEHHAAFCAWHIYSGDRHCSCGRDEAVKQLAELRQRANVLPLFAPSPSERVTRKDE
jgi:hypothetical protein